MTIPVLQMERDWPFKGWVSACSCKESITGNQSATCKGLFESGHMIKIRKFYFVSDAIRSATRTLQEKILKGISKCIITQVHLIQSYFKLLTNISCMAKYRTKITGLDRPHVLGVFYDVRKNVNKDYGRAHCVNVCIE